MRVGLTITTLLMASIALHADTPHARMNRSSLQSGAERIATSAVPSYMVEFSDTLQIDPPTDVPSAKKRSLPAQVVPGIQSAAHSAARFLTEKVLRLR
jgi:hypothetical protein